MPNAGLAEAGRDLLRAAVADEATVARFRALTVQIPAAPCRVLWRGALAGRGHGRFWLGRAAGRDIVVISHRFAFAVEHDVDTLEQTPLLGHRCDNPLCQVIGPGHVEASTAWRNRQEWAMRRATVGGALRDVRGARGRARAIRDALRRDASIESLEAAAQVGLSADLDQLPLWE